MEAGCWRLAVILNLIGTGRKRLTILGKLHGCYRAAITGSSPLDNASPSSFSDRHHSSVDARGLAYVSTHPLSRAKRFLVVKSKVLAKRGMSAQRGGGIIEALVGVGLLGVVASAFLPAIGTGALVSEKVVEVNTAVDLARAQVANVRSQPYSDSDFYPVTVTTVGDYVISITVLDESPPDNLKTLQRVTVKVSRGPRALLVLEDFKAK